MNEFNNQGSGDFSDIFDQDYSTSNELMVPERHDVPSLDINSFSNYNSDDIFRSQDPLKHVHKFNFDPCRIDLGNSHFVKPHDVDGYIRKDGVAVEGYYRDGDGDTSINRTVEQGGGYDRTNPDGIPWNNFNK